MTTPDIIEEIASDTPLAVTRPFYWSVRRELWEHRSLYLAPLAVAALAIFGFVVSLLRPAQTPDGLKAIDSTLQPTALAMPYAHAAMLLMLTGVVVSVFYSLDALYSERRDRSILFWKSLPVSDATSVLAKASIPLAVMPLLVFAISVALQWVMLLLSVVTLLVNGGSVAAWWQQLPLIQLEVSLFYSLIAISLWHAPVYAWLLLVSSWARRTPLLWGILPPLAVALVELIALRSTHVGSFLVARVVGFTTAAYDWTMPDGTPVDPHFIPVSALAPGKLLSSPGLWVGLAIAAAFLVAAVRLRRDREPL